MSLSGRESTEKVMGRVNVPFIWDVLNGCSPRVQPFMTSTRRGQTDACGWGPGFRSKWMSTQKIRNHRRHPVFLSIFCHAKKLASLYQNFVFGRNKKWTLFVNLNSNTNY